MAAIVNDAPRPESCFTDYETAIGGNLTEQQRSDLYAELASGADSGNILTRLGNFAMRFSDTMVSMSLGWDYTVRWLKKPLVRNLTDQLPKVRTLNIRNSRSA
jgi:alpha,alpha-trehalase